MHEKKTSKYALIIIPLKTSKMCSKNAKSKEYFIFFKIFSSMLIIYLCIIL
jgi:hypothetical protein